jgi:uncharacterized protein YndB with AHSA1/START domain
MTAYPSKETEMVDILHRVGVAAPPAAVYDQLATTSGLQNWWTHDVRGESAVGEKVSFFFGAPDRFFVMEVVELEPDDRVAWRVVDGADEWIDTLITFDIVAREDETIVLFKHAGWREPVEFMHLCSTKWASYLISLKQGIETGHARPFPDDVKMSSFD